MQNINILKEYLLLINGCYMNVLQVLVDVLEHDSLKTGFDRKYTVPE